MAEDWDGVRTMLTERGVDRVDDLLGEIDDLAAVLGAIKWWDGIPRERAGTGLLVSKIRDGGLPGYQRPHERSGPEGELLITPEQLKRMKTICLSPDGFSLFEAEEMFRKRAERANTDLRGLIASAIGERWRGTPTHPALIGPHDEEPAFLSLDDRARICRTRYSLWVRGVAVEKGPPNTNAQRADGESDYDYARRFWHWNEPQPVVEVRDTLVAAHKAAREASSDEGDLW
jgi:hypothetical protein